MRTEICLHLALANILLSSNALILDISKQEFFCFQTKTEIGSSQCTFLRRSSAVASVLFYWTIWTVDHRVEECSISAEPSLIQNYISVCHEKGWDLHKKSSLRLNISLLFNPGSPCEFRPIALGNFGRHRYTGYQVDSRFRIRQKRAWILPGTLWCGHGSHAGDYGQLGMFERVDRCCRDHDHCDHIIRPFTVNFGVFNPTLFTISHCDCDHRFKQCLLDINDTVSNMVGYTYFNLLKLKCFELIQKRRCTKMSWIGMCRSDKVAPYAILKYSTMYNATTSNTGTSKPPVCGRKLSSSTKQKNRKLKERKQSTSQKNHVQGASAAGRTVLLGAIIGEPYSTPKTISIVSNLAQPNCMMSCNTTLFHQKSKLIQQGTPFSAAASTVHVRTLSTKQLTIPSTGKRKKGKNITQSSHTTVQTGLIERYNPSKMSPNSNGSLPQAHNFPPKQQGGMNDMHDNVPFHATVSSEFLTLPVANKLLRTNKFFKGISHTKKEANFSRRKKTFNRSSSRSQPQNTSTSEMKPNSAESIKHSKTFEQTDALNKFLEKFKADTSKEEKDQRQALVLSAKMTG